MKELLSFQASWLMVLVIFLVMMVGLVFQYLLSGGKVGMLKTTWEDHLVSIVFCLCYSLALKIPGGIYIVSFFVAIGADKYFIPKLRRWFTKQ